MQIDGIPVGTPTGTPDPHIEWWRQHEELNRRHEALSQRLDELPSGADERIHVDEAMQAISAEQWAIMELIAETPATTLEGALIQMRVVGLGLEADIGDVHRTAGRSAIAAFERLMSPPTARSAS